MSLTVETGEIVADADSYISLDDARTLAANYGYSLPDDDTKAEVALRKGVWYVDAQEPRYNGTRTDDSQSLAWPRENAYYTYGTEIDSDAIPTKLQLGQVIAAATYGAGTDVRANDDGKSIASQAVSGAVSQSYFNNGKTGSSIVITEAMDAIATLLSGSGNNGISFEVYR
jgi:hypothetical protein